MMALNMSTNVPSMTQLISGPTMGMNGTAIAVPLMVHCLSLHNIRGSIMLLRPFSYITSHPN